MSRKKPPSTDQPEALVSSFPVEMDDRSLEPVEERNLEGSLRPRLLEEYIGQEGVKQN